MMITDVRGAATIRGEAWEQMSYFVLGYDREFHGVQYVTGFGESGARFMPVFDLRKDNSFISRPLIAFAAKKVDLIGLTDPLTLKPLTRLEVLDGRQNSKPRDYAIAGIPGGG